MPIRFDAEFQKHQGKLEDLILADDNFATIYDISSDRKSHRKPPTSNQFDRSAEGLARERMIQRMQCDSRGQVTEISESEARQRYVERLQRRKG